MYHKIGVGQVPEEINAVIEIPFRSNIKYEVDKESGAVMVDRIMRSAVYYPANYGFVPNTLALDEDPIDILVLNEYEFQAGSVIKCRLIGVLEMEDESGRDEKLLAVAINKIDPTFKNVHSYTDLAENTLQRIKNFFETYKLLEPNKWVKVQNFKGKEEAIQMLKDAIKNYEDKKLS